MVPFYQSDSNNLGFSVLENPTQIWRSRCRNSRILHQLRKKWSDFEEFSQNGVRFSWRIVKLSHRESAIFLKAKQVKHVQSTLRSECDNNNVLISAVEINLYATMSLNSLNHPVLVLSLSRSDHYFPTHVWVTR